jgi:hypothetical protein
MTSWSSAAAIRERVRAIRVGASLRLIRTETFAPTGSEPYTFREFQFTTGIVFR